MIVERIWTGNAYRNYNYLIACPETGEALAIDQPAVGQRLRELGVTPQGSTPAALAALLTREIARWGEVVRAAKIEPE